MIRHANVDRYLLNRLLDGDEDARERVRIARKRAPWFTDELFADVFYCFYLPHPTPDPNTDAPSFHRWFIRTLTEQYLYTSIRPRTAGAAAAAFRTALKATMWLTAQYAEEADRRKRQQRSMPALAEPGVSGEGAAAGMASGSGMEHGSERPSKGGKTKGDLSLPSLGESLSERLSAEKLERLKRVGFRLEEGKHAAEQRQNVQDTRPLVEADIAALRERIAALRELMRSDFVRRDKWKRKLGKAEQELAGRKRALDRLLETDNRSFAELDRELGEWLNGSLRQTLTAEETETKLVDDLINASLRFANRRWGNDLGKLRRQAYKHYLEWVERLKAHPDMIAMIEAVGRHTERLIRQRRHAAARMSADQYDELGLSADIAHMLPGDASLLADPDYETYFMVNMLEGKLMTYRAYSPVKEHGKGPVLCLLDTSHSMRGSKLRLAQIFVMTFAALTLYERRDFYLILFGAKGELMEVPLFHRKPDWPAFYRLSQLAFGGGTHFDAPLLRGMELVRGGHRFADADIVMVTDGIGAISPPVRAKLAEMGQDVKLRLHTLIVGSARQHKVEAYDILGVSHEVRFAASWDAREDENRSFLLNVMKY